MVSTLSMVFMSASAIIAFGLPVFLFLFMRKKYQLKVVPMLVGAAAFIIFALCLEQIMHFIVLRPGADGTIALLTDSPALYALYGIFAAGIFEETARFISFNLLKKRYRGIGTGLSYGIGHGGIEAILLAGFSMIGNLTISVMINTGSTVILGDSPQIASVLSALTDTEPSMFLLSGVERIFAVVFHISASVIVWVAVNKAGRIWLYPVAVFLHAGFNVSAVLYQIGVIKSIISVECIVGISAVVVVLLAFLIYKKSGPDKDFGSDKNPDLSNDSASGADSAPGNDPALVGDSAPGNDTGSKI